MPKGYYCATLHLENKSDLMEWNAGKALLEGMPYPGEGSALHIANCCSDRFVICLNNAFSGITIVHGLF